MHYPSFWSDFKLGKKSRFTNLIKFNLITVPYYTSQHIELIKKTYLVCRLSSLVLVVALSSFWGAEGHVQMVVDMFWRSPLSLWWYYIASVKSNG